MKNIGAESYYPKSRKAKYSLKALQGALFNYGLQNLGHSDT